MSMLHVGRAVGLHAAPRVVQAAAKGGRGAAKYTKSNLPSKICPVCNRPFEWRKKWEKASVDELPPPPLMPASFGMRSSTAASAAGGDEAAAASRPLSDAAPASQQAAHERRQAEQQPDSVDVFSQDVGNAVHLEHVNLEVTDPDLARLFYSEGLGLTPDPDTLGWQRGGPHVTWYNIGRQQLHIVKGPAQTTRGTITLKLPSPAAAAERLGRLQDLGAFEGTLFSLSTQSRPEADGDGALAVTCPWGQRFLLADAAPGFPWPAGIVELRLPCFPGSASQIGRFYSEVLEARVEEGGGAARVLLGPGSCLRFEEDASLGEHSEEAAKALWSGWHVAFYVAAFGPCFQRALGLGNNLLDHPYRDKSPDAAAALANAQFRFRDVVRLDAFGQRAGLLYRLGHEVRSLHHPGFMRPLYNRRE